jgi:hypothetical protein
MCAKCGVDSVLYLATDGKPVHQVTAREMKVQAYWCEKCELIICGSCVGVPDASSGMLIFKAKCPVCGESVKGKAEETNLIKK